MKEKTVSTYYVTISLAGDYNRARDICRECCFAVGLCVTVTPTTFIYTGGEEMGIIVRLINYPRFPKDPIAIWQQACELAEQLRQGLCQMSYLIESPSYTKWVTYKSD